MLAWSKEFLSALLTTPTGLPTRLVPDETPWMDLAKHELGISETKDPERVRTYLRATRLPQEYIQPSTPWCGGFMSYILEQAGYKSMRTASALDYLNYGIPISEPKYGCIIIYQRAGGGHVHFYEASNSLTYLGIGGNQNNSVCELNYLKARALGFRWPLRNN